MSNHTVAPDLSAEDAACRLSALLDLAMLKWRGELLGDDELAARWNTSPAFPARVRRDLTRAEHEGRVRGFHD